MPSQDESKRPAGSAGRSWFGRLTDQLAEGSALMSGLTSSDGPAELSGDVIGERLSVEPLDPLEPQAATAIVATSASMANSAFMTSCNG